MTKPLKIIKPAGLFHVVDGKRVDGPNSRMWGDVTGLWGDCTGLLGDPDDTPPGALPADIRDFAE